ncbi:MAG: class I SAM-dependent methyltransferase [Bacteroidetes bacterium]|nr:class I SAM-dependent methyltransferase [Bacteroidota bacterium]
MQPIILRSPRYDDQKITLPVEIADLSKPFNGSISSPKGDEYPVTRNIVRLLNGEIPKTTLAQDSNFIPLTAKGYEDFWRKSSIRSISGEDFTMGDEQNLLIEWLQVTPGELVLDLGTSTGLYPRTLFTSQPKARYVAIDLAMPMLREARSRAADEQCHVTWMEANAESLPFFAESVDAITCGGSLNEFYDPLKALFEARRVLRKGGAFFLMYLLEADTFVGKALQKASGIGGIKFWSKRASYKLFEQAGFTVECEKQLGIVQFVLLK